MVTSIELHGKQAQFIRILQFYDPELEVGCKVEVWEPTGRTLTVLDKTGELSHKARQFAADMHLAVSGFTEEEEI